jgi:hypothetical protein
LEAEKKEWTKEVFKRYFISSFSPPCISLNNPKTPKNQEFFQVLVNMLLDPAYGMFKYEEDTRYCWLNGASLESEKKFELVGTVLGLALYNGIILGISFPLVLYKKLLDEKILFEDFKAGFPVSFIPFHFLNVIINFCDFFCLLSLWAEVFSNY